VAASPAELHTQIAHLQERVAELEARVQASSKEDFAIELERVPIQWQLDQGSLSFFGLPAALFWLDPSLLRLFAPLVAEVSVPVARLLIAYHASLGTEEDYHAMVNTLGASFEEGFLNWGRAVGTAGWGQFSLPFFDRAAQKATVVVRRPWELMMQQTSTLQWGCPFLQGKITGIFSHALATPCWAEEQISTQDSTCPTVTFQIVPSANTIEEELQALRLQRQQDLDAERDALRELSTPLIPISDDVVIMPLIGTIDSQRAQQVMEALLEGVAQHQASLVILDITGVSVVDTQVAQAFIQAAQAVRLLGAQVMLTGIQPQIAQTLVHLGVDLSGIITHGSLQAGIAAALGESRAPRNILRRSIPGS
jgi:rsbT co-antagonist protein RsbR